MPLTAYIKTIDIWMIFTMMYPFCVVTLYVLQELVMNSEPDTPVSLVGSKAKEGWNGKGASMSRKILGAIRFMLDYGLPVLVIVFIVFFWGLGFNNRAQHDLHKTC